MKRMVLLVSILFVHSLLFAEVVFTEDYHITESISLYDSNDVIVELFQEAEDKLKEVLSVSLADLVSKQQSLRKNVTYSI